MAQQTGNVLGALAQGFDPQPKDLTLPQLWLRSDAWPGSSMFHRAAQKKKKKRKKERKKERKKKSIEMRSRKFKFLKA